jgi:hypothetical protein
MPSRAFAARSVNESLLDGFISHLPWLAATSVPAPRVGSSTRMAALSNLHRDVRSQWLGDFARRPSAEKVQSMGLGGGDIPGTSGIPGVGGAPDGGNK